MTATARRGRRWLVVVVRDGMGLSPPSLHGRPRWRRSPGPRVLTPRRWRDRRWPGVPGPHSRSGTCCAGTGRRALARTRQGWGPHRVGAGHTVPGGLRSAPSRHRTGTRYAVLIAAVAEDLELSGRPVGCVRPGRLGRAVGGRGSRRGCGSHRHGRGRTGSHPSGQHSLAVEGCRRGAGGCADALLFLLRPGLDGRRCSAGDLDPVAGTHAGPRSALSSSYGMYSSSARAARSSAGSRASRTTSPISCS